MNRRLTCVTAVMAVLLLGASVASAQTVLWTIVPSSSQATLALQTTTIPASVNPVGPFDLNIDIVNQAGAPQTWNDGNVGALTGTYTTTYTGSSVQFTSAAITGIDHTSSGSPNGTTIQPGTHTLGYTPNAALWNPIADDGTGHPNGNYTAVFPPAPAMWANNAFARELGLMATSNAFQHTIFNLNSAAPIPVSGGTFDPSTSNFGLTQTDFLLKSNAPSLVTSEIDLAHDPNANPDGHDPMVDGLPAPGTYGPNLGVAVLGAGAAGQIIPTGPGTYEMIYPFIEQFIFYVGDVPFGGSLSGQIVALGVVVPEPSTMLMAAFGLVGLVVAARRKLRKA